jgi:hypothetical protein
MPNLGEWPRTRRNAAPVDHGVFPLFAAAVQSAECRQNAACRPIRPPQACSLHVQLVEALSGVAEPITVPA